MLPAETVIADEGLSVSDAGLHLAVRLPWYRSLPLSTVEIAALQIDGDDIDLSSATFELDGQLFALREIADATGTFWYVLDSAFLTIPEFETRVGAEHRVALTINIFPPYIPGMKRSNPQTESLRVR